MFELFRAQEQIRPELIVAFNSRIPDTINVHIYQSKDGGYIAEVKDFDGCITQANSGKEIFEMVNDALYTYLDIPEAYRKYVTYFLPPREIQEQFNIEIPAEYLDRSVEIKKVTA